MPFIVTADRAAEIIRAGLTNGRARVVFPWRMYVLVRLVGALPRGLVSSFFAIFATGLVRASLREVQEIKSIWWRSKIFRMPA